MTAFVSISAREAAELVEAAGISDGRRLLIDSAAAGLVKTYADAIATVGLPSSRPPVRGCAIDAALWHRIVQSGDVDGIWCGGTVRLKGNGLTGGIDDVHVTGVRFGPGSLRGLIARHALQAYAVRADPLPDAPKAAPTPTSVDPFAPVDAAPASSPPARRMANPAAIPPGAITVTIKQAMAALGLGRTTVDKLCGANKLTRKKVGGRSLITVESIRALVGAGE